MRDFEAEDWPAVLAYQQHPEYLRYYPWTQRTESDVKGFLGIFRGWQEATPRFRFQLAVALKDTGELIGNAGIRCPRHGADCAELGYELAYEQWGKGYATEAAGAMLNFGLEQLKLRHITADCNAENLASARVLEKLGFSLDKRVDRAVYFKGRWWDSLEYSFSDPKVTQRAAK